ncbi:hypothetical protein P9314_06025 [Paenibacillus validus]|uniref:Uncharacterized protein n=1 Tax=Paenibacillus validus TaxID=44253 RepID=A0A7X3CRU2_9BACL|nr:MULTISPECIES: hypothetical protein [Paenibacillus]MED4600258.1 hypothetical protein [Paenibacillus validus]MED4605259.1 hypothetical protein [Paenibacillus validus]MUG69324.1 hypothetical protein [Paenibacillus validus]
MANEVFQEEELKYLLPFGPRENHETPAPSKKPKLTIRYLHNLITELQQQNLLLAQQVHDLERQLFECRQTHIELAAAAEQQALKESETKDEPDSFHDDQEAFRISRSKRHQAAKKVSFWSVLFRF